MIRVNLLPYHLRPIKRTPVPYILSVAVLLLAVGAMAAVFLGIQGQVAVKQAELDGILNKLSDLQAVVDEYNDLENKKEQLASKIATIDEIVRDRIIWSRQLWNLSRLAPDNFWYREIRVGTKQFREKVPTFDKATKKTVMKDISVSKPILTVSGYVVATEETGVSMSPFARATEQDEEFSSLFQLETSSLKDTEFEEYPVREFSLEYVLTPGGDAE